MNNYDLLICADVGARSSFVGAWLQKKLLPDLFDVGKEIGVSFLKVHYDQENNTAKKFNGSKLIRIRPDMLLVGMHLKLSLIKDVYGKIPEFQFADQSFDVFEKMYYSAKIWLNHDKQIDLNLYHKVINFSDTYDQTKMIDLYRWFNHGENPSNFEIQCFESCNHSNLPVLDNNDPCQIAALILKKEKKLNLNENERYWSIKNEFENSDRSTLYQRINKLIDPINYGKSDLYLQGINLDTDTLWTKLS